MTNSRNHRILLVEDEAILIKVETSVLKLSGFSEPLWAETGQQGLALLAVNSVDLILLDLTLPDMSGFQFLQCLRDNKVLNVPPVVLVSGELEEEVVTIQPIVWPVKGYIQKPFTVQHFVATISQALELDNSA